MKFSEIKNCKDCPYSKCLSKTDKDFDICPVEKRKQEFEKVD